VAPRILRKPCYGLAELCQRWSVTELDIANFAIAGELTLSVVVVRLPLEEGSVEEMEEGHFADIPERQHWFTGPLDLWPHDVWQVMTAGSHDVTSFRAEHGRYRSLWSRDAEAGAFTVPRDRLVVRHAELERFEAAQEAAAAAPPPPPIRVGARGATPKYDWDEFWCEVAVSMQIDGMPASQAAMVRRMEDWFATRDQHPDRSTLKKKIALLWRRHQEALARLPA
jgi:hypothetical protein